LNRTNITLRKFCETHSIKVLDTTKRAHRINKFNIKYFTHSEDLNTLAKEFIAYDTEPLYTVEIAESELEKIAEFESQVFNHLEQRGHYDMFNYIMEQKEKEKFLRHTYPSVKKAYEHYSLMLKLAESGEL